MPGARVGWAGLRPQGRQTTAVCLPRPHAGCTRPVVGPIRSMQMIGRGLRGPRNGGAAACQSVDDLDRCQELVDLEAIGCRSRQDFLAVVEAAGAPAA